MGDRKIIVPNHTRHLNLDSEPGPGLPVEAVIDDLKQILSNNPCAVLQAPPEAGKTTCIPLSLLNAPWLEGRKILILAPRRLAALPVHPRLAYMMVAASRMGKGGAACDLAGRILADCLSPGKKGVKGALSQTLLAG